MKMMMNNILTSGGLNKDYKKSFYLWAACDYFYFTWLMDRKQTTS